MVELKMVAVREQVGIIFIPGGVPNLDDGPGSTSIEMLEQNLEKVVNELLWRAAILGPARCQSPRYNP